MFPSFSPIFVPSYGSLKLPCETSVVKSISSLFQSVPCDFPKKKKGIKHLNTDKFSDLRSTSNHPSSHIFCTENGLHFSPFTQWSIESNSLYQRGNCSVQSSGGSSECLLYLSSVSEDMRHKPRLLMLHRCTHVNMIPLLTLTLSTLYFAP